MNAKAKSSLVPFSLVVVWLAFAAWQYHEFGHVRDRERADLIGQSNVLRQALLGAARARRRLGRLFEEQMQAVLEEIADTSGVVAVYLRDDNQWVSLGAGRIDLLDSSENSPIWLPSGLQTTGQCELSFMPPGQSSGGGGPAWMRDMNADPLSTRLRLTLLMDRTSTDAAIRAAAKLRLAIALAGGAVLGAVGLIWVMAFRAIQARAQNELLRAEKQRLEELSQAASGLAHETRNPLGVIRGGLQKLLRDGHATHAIDEGSQLSLLIEECDRVTSRINQFLSYARSQLAELKDVQLGPLLDELKTLLQPDLEDKRLRLEFCGAQDGDAIVADASLLRQVLFNLLQNAINFSPPGESIEVNIVKRQSGRVAIQVADRGPGIPQEDAERLFSPYFTTRSDGAGLGLAIVRRLAKQLGWSVHYEPRVDGGSLFVIEGVRVATNSPNPDR